MANKKTLHYKMDFENSKLWVAAAMMGASFFLRVAYFFGFTRLEDVGAWNLLAFLILPVVVELAFMVLLRGIRLNAPGVYGILGAAYCFLQLLQSFQYGDVLRTVLAVVAYIGCGALLFITAGGMLKKGFAVAALIVTALVRLLAFDLSAYILKLRLISFLPEAAAICGLLALGYVAWGLKAPKK